MERFLKGIYTVIVTILVLSVTFTCVFAEDAGTTPGIEEVALNASSEADTMNVVYNSNNEGVGWNAASSNGEVTGNAEQNMKAFAVSVPEAVGDVQFRSLVGNEGWQDWKDSDEGFTGDLNTGNDIEAIQIQLTEGAENQNDIYYKANVEGLGWLDWAKNGEMAGTEGLGKSIREVQVMATPKNAEAPGATACAAIDSAELSRLSEVDYSAHVSTQGWQPTVSDGEVAGTTGAGLSIEALRISVPNAVDLGDGSTIQYSVQSENVGWTPEVSNNADAGTTGQSLNAEAVRIHLTGRMASLFDSYYRVHSAYYGWLDWTSDGQTAGTEGIGTAAEAVQIELVPKGSPAPGETARPAITPDYLQSRAQVNYNTHVQNIGWQSGFSNGVDAGTTNQGLQVEAFTIDMPNRVNGSSLTYQAHVQDIGWQEPVSDGAIAGTQGEGKAVQAFTVALTGEDSYSFDVYYQAYCQDFGWLGWAKNGEWAGTTGGQKRLEAMRVMLVPRGGAAPGSTENACINIEPVQVDNSWRWPLDSYFDLSSGFGWRPGENHLGLDIPAPTGTPIKAAKSGTVTLAEYYGGYGNCVIITNDSGEDVYYAHQSALNTTAGTHVNKGDVIGFVGSTGYSTGPHLHFGVCIHGTWVNPLDLY